MILKTLGMNKKKLPKKPELNLVSLDESSVLIPITAAKKLENNFIRVTG